MAQGNFENGDYFIDCNWASQSTTRAIYGVWINVCVATVAFCIRSIYRSQVISQLLANDSGKRLVNIWRISPPTSTSEVFQLRLVLLRSLFRGHLLYVIASLFCVVAALVSAASTTIANRAVVKNVVVRKAIVPGRLLTREHGTIAVAVVNNTARAKALEQAGAPLEQVFDFIPDDTSGWSFRTEEWNNTWQGKCNYYKHPSVYLEVKPTGSTNFQDEVPLLANWLPQWATTNGTSQANRYAGFYTNANITGYGSWRDLLVTYFFSTAPTDNFTNASNSVNISFANYAAHNVARGGNTTYFELARLQSDVHVVDCNFENTKPGIPDQGRPDNNAASNTVQNVVEMYTRSFVEASIADLPVVQPTAQEMLRNWQAFSSVRDGQYPHMVQRALSVSQPVVQLRLSILVATGGAFVLSLMAATIAHFTEPLDQRHKHIILPSSQFDWTVQAARERHNSGEKSKTLSSISYAKQREDLLYVISGAEDRQVTAYIASSRNEAADTPPHLKFPRQQSLRIDPEKGPPPSPYLSPVITSR